MRRVLILVEGQTEERFVKDVLQPHLWGHDVDVVPKLIATSRTKEGVTFKGGVVSFGSVEHDLRHLLRDRNAALVTTMLDYYGLPSDFPGSGRPVVEMERALEMRIGDPRFRAFYVLHEFEGLLFSQPETIAQIMMAKPKDLSRLQEIRGRVSSPEDINQGPETHPSKRLRRLFERYRKTIHGAQICGAIGLQAIRDQCPHFAQWLDSLEKLT